MTPAIREWAARWGLPAECLQELAALFGAVDNPPQIAAPTGARENWTMSTVQLEASRCGVWLTRNNVGAQLIADPDTGQRRMIRWGLANESKERNASIKSGDLIGIRPVTITPQHVGSTIGQFVSRECKRPGWTYRGDAHEQAQANWAALVTRYGGDARFATGEGSFE